jgi:methylenetetrahydrofolate--tRNA-(uracil-5-)-methyltransferase
LTSDALQAEFSRLTGRESLHFYDAIAPTVTLGSLDTSLLYRASRYGRGSADYLNAPLSKSAYLEFRDALVTAERAQVHEFDRSELFAGCQPIEEIADAGEQTLAYGPLRPVGLEEPGTGDRPHAVVQLRQENRAGTLYGLVGFQTRLKRGEQRRVFRSLPGLATAEFVRYGQLHRNFYLDTPRTLTPTFALRERPHIRVAGQITGVEGYVESIASGLLSAWHTAAELLGLPLPTWPRTTLIGALLGDFLFDTTTERLVPMNVNFGLLPPANVRVRGRRERRLAHAERSLRDLDTYLAGDTLQRLLARAD